MKSIWFLVTAALFIIVAVTTAPSAAQNTNMVKESMPNQNQMEPLDRRARQFDGGEWWVPPKWNPPGTFPGFRGGGGELEMLACNILCPDDDDGFIPYRAPRPTKGKFIPIHG